MRAGGSLVCVFFPCPPPPALPVKYNTNRFGVVLFVKKLTESFCLFFVLPTLQVARLRRFCLFVCLFFFFLSFFLFLFSALHVNVSWSARNFRFSFSTPPPPPPAPPPPTPPPPGPVQRRAYGFVCWFLLLSIHVVFCTYVVSVLGFGGVQVSFTHVAIQCFHLVLFSRDQCLFFSTFVSRLCTCFPTESYKLGYIM